MSQHVSRITANMHSLMSRTNPHNEDRLFVVNRMLLSMQIIILPLKMRPPLS
jgi:hypothetical protein